MRVLVTGGAMSSSPLSIRFFEADADSRGVIECARVGVVALLRTKTRHISFCSPLWANKAIAAVLTAKLYAAIFMLTLVARVAEWCQVVQSITRFVMIYVVQFRIIRMWCAMCKPPYDMRTEGVAAAVGAGVIRPVYAKPPLVIEVPVIPSSRYPYLVFSGELAL